ncbi:MAG: hypothetical protein QOF30_929 [Acidimicrobiaceae bacterium]|jgi:hypothetical protein|nr:hypothetical protein [Acidimicrobiaceae bacterium]
MSAPTLGAHSGPMFTFNAVQQMATDHRRSMMSEAATARALHAAAVATPASERVGRLSTLRQARSIRRSTGMLASLHRS